MLRPPSYQYMLRLESAPMYSRSFCGGGREGGRGDTELLSRNKHNSLICERLRQNIVKPKPILRTNSIWILYTNRAVYT